GGAAADERQDRQGHGEHCDGSHGKLPFIKKIDWNAQTMSRIVTRCKTSSRSACGRTFPTAARDRGESLVSRTPGCLSKSCGRRLILAAAYGQERSESVIARTANLSMRIAALDLMILAVTSFRSAKHWKSPCNVLEVV